jgi:hypothetical protein
MILAPMCSDEASNRNHTPRLYRCHYIAAEARCKLMTR